MQAVILGNISLNNKRSNYEIIESEMHSLEKRIAIHL